LSEQIFRVNKTKGCEAAVLRPQQAQISKPVLSGHGIITSGQIGLIWVNKVYGSGEKGVQGLKLAGWRN
jgi:hypothetical protein